MWCGLVQVLEKMTETGAVGGKRRRLEAQHGLLGDVRSERVVEGTLADALADYVERIDTDMVPVLICLPSFVIRLSLCHTFHQGVEGIITKLEAIELDAEYYCRRFQSSLAHIPLALPADCLPSDRLH